MNKTIRNILAIIIAITVTSSIKINATQPNLATVSETEQPTKETESPVTTEIETDDLMFPTAFMELDEEALEELESYTFEDFEDLENLETENPLAQDIIAYAKNFLGRPYVYGAVGPKQFDCSGFTSYIFRHHGITLKRTSRQQALQGVKVSTKDVKPGDLLFFSGRGGGSTVGHVAMAVSVNEKGVIKFIHASCSKGISYATYPDSGYYSRRFLGARRVIESDKNYTME